MSKAFDFAKEITVAAINSSNCDYFIAKPELGKLAAEFFENVYEKLKVLEENDYND